MKRMRHWSLLGLMMAAVPAFAQSGERVDLGTFSIDQTEVSVSAFRKYSAARSITTAAERAGGGFEFDGGWVRRAGWTWSKPFGTTAGEDEPAVHVSWSEARDYCTAAGGRLPTSAEWQAAAFTESRSRPTNGFVNGRTYRYPVGDEPGGMNTSGDDRWPRLAAVGTTKRGVNGLYDMGGNAWEWLADRRDGDALTAGGSWWYGAEKTSASASLWKDADFYAVYIGFRCVY